MPPLSRENLEWLYRREIERDYSGTERDERLARYEAMVADGQEPGFAAMLACNKPPGARGTDRALMEGGQEQQFSRMAPVNVKRLLELARKAGIDTTGKRYMGGLGRPNDPLAWISDSHDVLKACQKKNFNCQGAVSHKAVDMPPPPPVPLAEDLIQEEIRNRCQADPSLAERVQKNPKVKQELREAVIDRHAYKKPTVKDH